jgi:hypothetical protein
VKNNKESEELTRSVNEVNKARSSISKSFFLSQTLWALSSLIFKHSMAICGSSQALKDVKIPLYLVYIAQVLSIAKPRTAASSPYSDSFSRPFYCDNHHSHNNHLFGAWQRLEVYHHPQLPTWGNTPNNQHQ